MIETRILPLVALLLTAAIFGFFYAWVCSTMWGLDQLTPEHAIEAMQAMNASVRNPVFFPAFFLTPVVLLASALALFLKQHRYAAAFFGAAAIIYLLGGFVPTALINVPMNRALAEIDLANRANDFAQIWRSYSDRWQLWNTVRTVASGLAVIMAGLGLMELGKLSPAQPQRTS